MENIQQQFANAIQTDHLTKSELDLIEEMFKDFS
jgi:hypothetical protein